MNLLATLRVALNALRVNKLRSILTMLGIIIGVGAVITMIAVGGGAQERVAEQIKSLGSNLMIIIPGSTTTSGVRLGAGANLNLTEDDAISIAKEVPEVQVAAPSSRGSGQVIYGGSNWSTQILGVTPDYFGARDWPLISGRMFEQAEMAGSAKVAILGQTVSQQLFGDMDPLDQTIRIRTVPFKIVGVLDRKGQSMLAQEASSRIMTLLLAAVASVSLLVGGIGIMNIMLVSVTERTREIGLRMAVGARGKDILTQFLVEAVTLSLIGGFLGIVLGVLGSYLIGEFAGWTTRLSPESIVLAVGFSAAIGIFFGFYPARKAASLLPIQALRYE